MAGRRIPPVERAQIVADWLDTGSYTAVAKRHNVTEGAIRRQRKDSPWWDEIEHELTQALHDSTKTKLSAVSRTVIDLIADRLSEGDPVVLKDGTIIFAPVRTRDLVLSLGILVDKLRLMEGQPTKLVATADLNQLADQFRSLARGSGTTIQGTVQLQDGAPSDPGAGAKSSRP
jgi:transposase-like protein